MDFDFLLRSFCFILVTRIGIYALEKTTISTDNLLCYDVRDSFSTKHVEARESSQGPRGPIGKHGLRGPMGEVDSSRIHEILDDELGLIKARLEKAEKEMEEITEKIKRGQGNGNQFPEDSKYEKECLDKFGTTIHFGPMCYRIVEKISNSFSFTRAEAKCIELGGYLADLPSREVYNLLYDYVDRTFFSSVIAWTGMRLDSDTNTVKLTTGQNATYEKWADEYPDDSGDTYLPVVIDGAERKMGIKNYYESNTEDYALCQYNLTGITARPEKHFSSTDDYYSTNYYSTNYNSTFYG